MAEAVYDSLTAAGAGQFVKLSRWLSQITTALDAGQLQLIVAPDDGAIDLLFSKLGKPASELLQSKAFENVILNHYSRVFDTKVPSMKMLGGFDLKLSKENLDKLKLRSNFVVNNVKILVVGAMLANPQQVRSLIQPRDAGLLGNLKPDTLAVMTAVGNLRGKDLISLCLSNDYLNTLCDKADSNGQTIFHKLLRSEFNVELAPAANARAEYVKRHTRSTFYIELVGGRVDKTITLTNNLMERGGAAKSYSYKLTKLSNEYIQVKAVSPGAALGLKYTGTLWEITAAGDQLIELGAKVKKIDSVGELVYALTVDGRIFQWWTKRYDAQKPTLVESKYQVIDIHGDDHSATFRNAAGQLIHTKINQLEYDRPMWSIDASQIIKFVDTDERHGVAYLRRAGDFYDLYYIDEDGEPQNLINTRHWLSKSINIDLIRMNSESTIVYVTGENKICIQKTTFWDDEDNGYGEFDDGTIDPQIVQHFVNMFIGAKITQLCHVGNYSDNRTRQELTGFMFLQEGGILTTVYYNLVTRRPSVSPVNNVPGLKAVFKNRIFLFN